MICEGSNGTEFAAGHAVFFDGRVAMLTVAHSNCGGITPPSFIACDGIDVAIKEGCPLDDHVKRLLDIKAPAKMRLGDKLVVGWFQRDGDDREFLIRAHTSMFVGRLGYVHDGFHFRGPDHAISIRKEYLMNANNYLTGHLSFLEMSGAVAASSCGYLGLGHTVKMSDATYSVVVPADNIKKCLMDNKERLKTMAECGYSMDRVVTLPLMELCPTFI